MKNLILVALTLFCLSSYAGGVGNGGGVICISAGNCVTLAEAGLRVKYQPEGFYRLPQALIDHTKLIIELSGLHPVIQSRLYKRVLGNTKTYQPVETIDEKKLAQLKAAYLKTVNNLDANFKLNNFEIVAWSDPENDVTYLLPRFYELTLRRQALLLIHEANVRSRNGDEVLKAALEFDVLFQSLVADQTMINNPNFDWVTFFKAIELLYLRPRDINLESMVLRSVFAKNQKKSLPLNKICPNAYMDLRQKGNYLYSFTACKTDYELLLKLADIDPRLVIYLENKKVFAGVGLRYSFKAEEANKVSAEHWSYEYGQPSADVDAFIEKDQNQTYQEYLSICNSTTGDDFIEHKYDGKFLKTSIHLVVDERLPSIQSKVFLLHCQSESLNGVRQPWALDEIKLVPANQ